MITLKLILVPTDFSEPSAAALRYGTAFADTFHASLHLLHVVEEPVVFGWETYDPAAVRASREQSARQLLRQLLPDAERERFGTHCEVRVGSPFVQIVRYAREQDIDLIVMGTHGRGPIAHMLLGSVAEKVVRKASCPVLTVRHPGHAFVMP